MYKLSYEKCVCFIFLVILAFLSCSGFHIDKMVPLPDNNNKKYPFTSPHPSHSTNSYNENAHESDFFIDHPHMMENRKLNERGEIKGVHGQHLAGVLPLQELQRAYERRRKRRIRTARIHQHHRRNHSITATDLALSNNERQPNENPPDEQTPVADTYLATRSRRTVRQKQRRKDGKEGKDGGKGGRSRFCPGQDVGTRAYAATTILEGKIRSKTSEKILRNRSTYYVTYEVKEVLRDRSGLRPVVKNESIRLQFANERNKTGNCDIKLVNGVVAAQLSSSKHYVLFANRKGDHDYEINGPPVESTQKNLKEIRRILNNQVKAPSFVQPLKGTTVKSGKRLRLVCKTNGNPPPSIHWYKDGRDLQNISSKRIRIQHKRKRTVLTIPKVQPEDSGQYTCVAKGVIGEQISTSAKVEVQPKPPPNSLDKDPSGSSPCPEIWKGFCLNGGSCLFFQTVGEYACKCADGYTGQRCQNKDVTSKSSRYPNSSRTCKLGLSTSYYC